MDPLFMLAGTAVVILGSGVFRTFRLSRLLKKRLRPQTALPQVMHVAIVATQLYELVLVIKHTSLVTVTAALLLLAIVLASKTGTEDSRR